MDQVHDDSGFVMYLNFSHQVCQSQDARNGASKLVCIDESVFFQGSVLSFKFPGSFLDQQLEIRVDPVDFVRLVPNLLIA